MNNRGQDHAENRACRTNTAFPGTRWSMVLKACSGSKEALEELGQAYWPAVYGFLRYHGFSPDDAKDITQNTFLRLLKGGCLAPADPDRGRFRSFLRACAENEASHFREQGAAAKRGGGRTESLNMLEAEEHFSALPVNGAPPEHIFDRAWSEIIVKRSLAKLASDYERLDKGHIYQALLPLLRGGLERGDHRVLAEKLTMTEANARVTWTRFKASFIGHLRTEIAETVADPAEVQTELRYLIKAWLSTGQPSI